MSPEIIIDYNENNEIIGIEILHLSKRSSRLKPTTLEFEAV